ncbi:MAG: tRNA preQ1(34) S-adenosylmethionine ribosyltransferase-isomerase QueA [Planctomycetes bacterium]|nr:tRNA preQ1(34) S-adenosylmethionine ribosyltransferase-isomerase QueA [Planctomycetota bacterium]
MRTELLDYTLPPEVIAQSPADRRSESRLLVLHRNTGRLEDRHFADLTDYLKSGDCLVLNNTKVLPARFYFLRSAATQMEALFLYEKYPGVWLVMVKNAKRIKPDETLTLLDRDNQPAGQCKAIQRTENGNWIFHLEQKDSVETILQKIGFAPLPPYIKRQPLDAGVLPTLAWAGKDTAENDLARYQTVYAEKAGAIAAPTAGLHFDKDLLQKIEAMGIPTARCTLHVGTGTFKPVQTETLEEHPIHSEFYEMPADAADTINRIRHAGGRIIAIGTTSVRTLETVAKDGFACFASGSTNLFITPGFRFQLTDAMVTNFHLPRSTLLALVAAFAGLDMILNAYRHAIENKYRFYSYGDAMLIL